MSTKPREVIWGGAVMGAKMRAKGAREAAQKAASEAIRAEAALVGANGGVWRPRPAIPNHRPMHRRRIRRLR
jgi:hypothetical protein